jgi:hypothetical protein
MKKSGHREGLSDQSGFCNKESNIKLCGWFTLMVGPQGVKNVEALKGLKGLKGTALEILIRHFGPFCCDEFSEFAITILRSGLF